MCGARKSYYPIHSWAGFGGSVGRQEAQLSALVLGGPEAGVTGAEQRETGRCASASARTGAGVSATASRGACLVSSCSPNQALILEMEGAHIPAPAASKSAYERAPPRNHEHKVKWQRLRFEFRHRFPTRTQVRHGGGRDSQLTAGVSVCVCPRAREGERERD